MKFIAKLLILFFAASLAAFVVLWHVQSILGSADNVDHVLTKSGAYSDLAQIIGQSFKDDVTSSAYSTAFGANISSGISSAVNGPLVGQIIQPTMKNLITWLNSTTAAAPNLTVDTSAAKSAIAAKSTNGGSTTLTDSIGFDVQRLLPDSITITGKSGGDQTSAEATQNLNQLRLAYQSLKRQLLYTGIAVVVFGGLLVLVSWHKRRRALRRLGIGFVMASVFVLIIVYPIRLILTHTIFGSSTASSVDQLGLVLAHNLSNYLLLGLLPYAIGLAVLGVILYAAGLLIPGAHDNKDDKKDKKDKNKLKSSSPSGSAISR